MPEGVIVIRGALVVLCAPKGFGVVDLVNWGGVFFLLGGNFGHYNNKMQLQPI